MFEITSLFKTCEYPADGWKLDDAGIIRGSDIIAARFSGPDGARSEIHLRLAGRGRGVKETKHFSIIVPDAAGARNESGALLDAVSSAMRGAEAEPDFDPGIFEELLAPEILSTDIWITPRCNQKCVFCDIPPNWELVRATPEEVAETIKTEYARGVRSLKFAGRECTLDKGLPGYIELAKKTGYKFVQVMTNAAGLAKGKAAARLKSAGLDLAVVSLHGHEAEISDAITGVPGDFEKTLAGISNILQAGISLELNYVLCKANYSTFPEYVRFVNEEHGKDLGRLMVSSVVPVYRALENYREVVPRLSDMAPFVGEGLEFCRRENVAACVQDLCGFPACFAPGHAEMFEAVKRQRFAEKVDIKLNPESCAECRALPYCNGYWNEYFNIYGATEFEGRRL